MSHVTIAAVGDILVSGIICGSVKRIPDADYDFDRIFEPVAPYLREADFTIGNLEVPLSGNRCFRKLRNPATGFYRFNAPESLGGALRRAGFDFLGTANNHCLDSGPEGLTRTLQVLDGEGIGHTGTYAAPEDAERASIREVNGVRIGVLAYSKSTNGMPLPSGRPWAVNRIDERKIVGDLKRLRPQVDVLLVLPHFGTEYRTSPDATQRRLVRTMLRHGADLILGAHPHIVQRLERTGDGRLAVYSLGNFVSPRLRRNPLTSGGVILQLKLRKTGEGRVEFVEMKALPTWTQRPFGPKDSYRVVPIREAQIHRTAGIPERERRRMEAVRRHIVQCMTPGAAHARL